MSATSPEACSVTQTARVERLLGSAYLVPRREQATIRSAVLNLRTSLGYRGGIDSEIAQSRRPKSTAGLGLCTGFSYMQLVNT